MIIWTIVLCGLIALFWLAVSMIRRRLDRGSSQGMGLWTLHDLRAMLDSGELTVQEFERLRTQIIDELRDTSPTDSEGMIRPPNQERPPDDR